MNQESARRAILSAIGDDKHLICRQTLSDDSGFFEIELAYPELAIWRAAVPLAVQRLQTVPPEIVALVRLILHIGCEEGRAFQTFFFPQDASAISSSLQELPTVVAEDDDGEYGWRGTAWKSIYENSSD